MEIHRSSAHNNDVNECCCCQMTANKEFYNELEKIFKTTKE